MRKFTLFILVACTISHVFATNEVNTPIINIGSRIIANDSLQRAYCYNKSRCDTVLVNKFYLSNQLTPIWVTDNGTLKPIAFELIKKLASSDSEGLNPDNYHINQINSLISQLKTHPSNSIILDLELSLTNAFFLYASHLAFGQTNIQKNYPDWVITKRSFNLIDLLNQIVKQQSLESVLVALNPKFSGYYTLKAALERYQAIAQQGGFETIPQGSILKPKAKGLRVKRLNERLVITGELNKNDITDYDDYSNATKKAVELFQQNHGITPTGNADKLTLQALNIPIQQIINTIAVNMDRMRWLPDTIGNNYIWINIPDFSLEAIENNSIVLSMPIIVGKYSTKSCVLDSNIIYIELNPYWTIPRSIAMKDILPKLQESPTYLQRKGIIIYKNSISESTIINSSQITWQNINPTNFDYILRQNPSAQNSLGKIKFVFPNNCGIYLHDTPERSLFKRKKRDYSHGCIRVGKPLELATFLLKDKPPYTTNRIESLINSGSRKIINLAIPKEIHIVYFTAWINGSGQLQLRPDIYKVD